MIFSPSLKYQVSKKSLLLVVNYLLIAIWIFNIFIILNNFAITSAFKVKKVHERCANTNINIVKSSGLIIVIFRY